jgi:hypothetical protein
MQLRHALIAVAVAVASVTAVGTTPASATVSAVTAQATDGFVTVYGSATAVATPNLDGTVNVRVACEAHTADAVGETGVGCYIAGTVDGLGRYMPMDSFSGGHAAQTSYEWDWQPAQSYYVCMNVGYRPGNASYWLPGGPFCGFVV